MSDSDQALVCTLDGASYQQRVEEIRAIFARSLRGSQRDGPRLRLMFDTQARAEVEELVRKERACCAFLDFHVEARNGLVALTITAPPNASEGADDLLAPFATLAGSSSCGCSAPR